MPVFVNDGCLHWPAFSKTYDKNQLWNYKYLLNIGFPELVNNEIIDDPENENEKDENNEVKKDKND